MKRYPNIAGTSGIDAYEIGADHIDIRYTTGGVYSYTYESAGGKHIEMMKVLALKGKGLNTYINQHIRDRYERKIG